MRPTGPLIGGVASSFDNRRLNNNNFDHTDFPPPPPPLPRPPLALFTRAGTSTSDASLLPPIKRRRNDTDNTSPPIAHFDEWQQRGRALARQWSVRSAKRILCSCFDGIGAAALILSILCIPVLAYVSWEIDQRCNELTSKLFPHVQHRGDFTKDNLDDLITFLDSVDLQQESEIVFCAGPPCPDFSQTWFQRTWQEGCGGGEVRTMHQLPERVRLPHSTTFPHLVRKRSDGSCRATAFRRPPSH